MWYVLLVFLPLSAMEPQFHNVELFPSGHDTVITKLDALKDRPWHQQIQFWKPNKEYVEAKVAVHDYLRNLDHLSREQEDVVRERRDNLEMLIQAAHQVRIQEEAKAHKLSNGSKVKIGAGGQMILLSLAQIGVSLATTEESYKMTSDIVVSLGGLASGGLLIYEGYKNVDGKQDAGRAAYLHLLLLEKFQELNAKK